MFSFVDQNGRIAASWSVLGLLVTAALLLSFGLDPASILMG